ncbi:hypothetical protein LCGC14_0671050 [marine sediment metagenome]|uniref:Uncharacterized protein n=1 Tax=marine sediment metagenome TaxID=412755 RepID=A0A0F9QQV0_9ZZZZ
MDYSSYDNGFDVLLDTITLCLAPFTFVGALSNWGKKIFLKLRRWGADILRPKDVVTARHTEPQSDLVRQFVQYELLLVSGKETLDARKV